VQHTLNDEQDTILFTTVIIHLQFEFEPTGSLTHTQLDILNHV